MSLRRSWVIARHDARILRSDPTFLLIDLAMPFVIIAFMKPVFRSALVLEGARGANGAEQAVPGTAVMFAFFLVYYVAFGTFREHGWNTWERLRASWARPAEVMLGKAVVPLATMALQLAVLLGVGGLAFGLHVRGSVVALAAVAMALAVCLVCLGFMFLALCRTAMQLSALANLAPLAFVGLGGALTPISALPGWARAVAPATPSCWAMRGFRAVIFEDGGLQAVVLPCALLLVFASVFAGVAMFRFRFEETKVSYA